MFDCKTSESNFMFDILFSVSFGLSVVRYYHRLTQHTVEVFATVSKATHPWTCCTMRLSGPCWAPPCQLMRKRSPCRAITSEHIEQWRGLYLELEPTLLWDPKGSRHHLVFFQLLRAISDDVRFVWARVQRICPGALLKTPCRRNFASQTGVIGCQQHLILSPRSIILVNGCQKHPQVKTWQLQGKSLESLKNVVWTKTSYLVLIGFLNITP